MTLNKKKFRYIAVFFPCKSSFFPDNIFIEFSTRYIELFGTIGYSNSLTRLVKTKNPIDNILLLKCSLDSLSDTLISLYLISQELIIVSVSGTLRHVKNKIRLFQRNITDDCILKKLPSKEILT
jgi:RNase P/RNase MRP subunit POP5